MTEIPTGSDESGLAVAQTDQTGSDGEYYQAKLDEALELIADYSHM